ncbi:hypothetical protein B9Z55_003398 [Caenorhabditis nigoni]|uniref:DUF7154 domain-containing protein n=1 Tax=Caenorhabditis nigoni TaxID=1611254 RepID=A0A2G5VQ50_9PELO|nr:hypothetical protein B9Z55_003398 [Caenorhabditis nigoni]
MIINRFAFIIIPTDSHTNDSLYKGTSGFILSENIAMKFLILLLPALFLTVNGCLRISWPEKCSPADLAAFLVAYSNDLEYEDVENLFKWYSGKILYFPRSKYAIAATVRFDTKTKEDITFHEGNSLSGSYSAAMSYVNETQVDPSQGFNSSETGSDVLDMLERYIDTNHKYLCGSLALIAMKRMPNEVEISKIVRRIREYRIRLNIAAVVDPSTSGLHPETMYNLAARTNGYCIFSSELSKAAMAQPELSESYMYYSSNLRVSGTGTLMLPPIALSPQTIIYLGVQSTATATSFQNLKMSYYNTHGYNNSNSLNREQLEPGKADEYSGALNSFITRSFFKYYEEASTYYLTFEYNYAMEDTILIRMHSSISIGHWFPYQD